MYGSEQDTRNRIHLSSLEEYLLIRRWSKVGHRPEENNRVIT